MKSLLQSKTFWFNLVVFVIGVLSLPEFISILPASWLPVSVFGGAVGNLILRVFFTSEPIKR